MSNTDKSAIFDGIQQKINNSEKVWSKVVRDLTVKLKETDVKDIIEVQADVINNRQLVVDEISIYGVKMWKEKQHIRKYEKLRFEFYATSYPIKTSGAEKLRLMNSDLADRQYIVDRYDEHVEHLRGSAKQLESLNYACKNKIELANMLGGYE